MKDTFLIRKTDKGISLFNLSCVLVWDTRPPKGPQQQGKEKKETSKNAMGVPDTFKHLDLTWKPMLKVKLLFIFLQTSSSDLSLC